MSDYVRGTKLRVALRVVAKARLLQGLLDLGLRSGASEPGKLSQINRKLSTL